MSVKLFANVCMHNEAAKGNLRRCLDNLKQYCNDIIIYDDASEDRSVNIAKWYTEHIIQGQINDQMNEITHKQIMLDRAVELGATHIWWLDCDEVLERDGTQGGLRKLCQRWPEGLDAYSFPEVNLWRSQTWARTDSLFDKAKFVRLWKVTPRIRFDCEHGVHLQLYPVTIQRIKEAPFRVLHYGFWDYLRMMEKIGAHGMDKNDLVACAEENWILDERNCSCYKIPLSWHPKKAIPTGIWPEPKPRKLGELSTAEELWESYPLTDIEYRTEPEAKTNAIHGDNYHGDYESIYDRNLRTWTEMVIDPINRMCMFQFDPQGKTIIDIGAGGGWFALDCIRAGAEKVICIELNAKLISDAKKSFESLGVPRERYEFVQVVPGQALELPAVDIVYAIAVFQHLPLPIARAWFRWTSRHLKAGGAAHFQFHKCNPEKEMVTFADGGQSISTAWLERDLLDAGLYFKRVRLAEGKGILPLWWMYELGVGQ